MKRIVCTVFAVLFIFILSSCAKEAPEKTPVISSVNGITVSEEEIAYYEGKLRSQVTSKFISEYGAVFDENFWDTEYQGITPQEYLDSVVKEAVIKAKIQLELCREKGIYEDVSYSALYRLALEYNETHKDTQSVGLQTIPLDSFYTYYVDNGVMELKNILGENELAPTDDEVNEMLKTAKEKYPQLNEKEQLAVAKDMLTENKYSEYIDTLYKKAITE